MNKSDFSTEVLRQSNKTSQYFEVKVAAAAVVPIIVFTLLGYIAIVILKIYFRRRWECDIEKSSSNITYAEELNICNIGESKIYKPVSTIAFERDGFSKQSTLVKQVSLIKMIGKGRFSEVWNGVWQGERVAVKIMPITEKSRWERETEIYSTILIRQENILGFIGSDMSTAKSDIQLWLITHFHHHGSLHDHLSEHIINYEKMLMFCLSLTNGILHLHTEIFGTKGKPAIAHRDIKSTNIMVKGNCTCCIGDFGVAVTYSQINDKLDITQNDKNRTIKYMSPEDLDNSIQQDHIESFKNADIYSLGLVFWEICRRTVSDGQVDDNLLPYFDNVSEDPTLEEMERVVCQENIRPTFSCRWNDDKILIEMQNIMTECWHRNPTVRLSALRVKKSLLKLSENISQN